MVVCIVCTILIIHKYINKQTIYLLTHSFNKFLSVITYWYIRCSRSDSTESALPSNGQVRWSGRQLLLRVLPLSQHALRAQRRLSYVTLCCLFSLLT